MTAFRLVTDGEGYGFQELGEAEEAEFREPWHPEFPVFIGDGELCGSIVDGEYVPDPGFVERHRD